MHNAATGNCGPLGSLQSTPASELVLKGLGGGEGGRKEVEWKGKEREERGTGAWDGGEGKGSGGSWNRAVDWLRPALHDDVIDKQSLLATPV